MRPVVKKLLPVLILVLGAGVLALMIRFRPEAIPSPVEVIPPLVEAHPLEPGPHTFRVRAQGTVSPRTEIQLVAEVAARVVAVAPAFATGGFFEPGEVLVSLDPRDYELALTRAEAALAEARTRLQREQAEAEVARAEWQRLGTGEPGPLLLREPQLAEAEAGVASALANLQTAERDLDRCRVRAPFAGRIRSRSADVGQFVNRGEVLARIHAVDYVEVRLPLPLSELAYVELPLNYRGETAEAEGPPVRLSARIGGRMESWSGRIVRTEGEIDPRTRMLTAVARVDDPYGRGSDWTRPPLAVGLFVEAEIEGRRFEGVFVAPRMGLRPDGRLLVVDGDDRMRFREIELLRLEGDRLVFRGGARPGDRVIAVALDVVTDGMRVRVAGDSGEMEDGARRREERP